MSNQQPLPEQTQRRAPTPEEAMLIKHGALSPSVLEMVEVTQIILPLKQTLAAMKEFATTHPQPDLTMMVKIGKNSCIHGPETDVKPQPVSNAVAFAEWLNEKYMRDDDTGNWFEWHIGDWDVEPKNHNQFTTAQLYQQFRSETGTAAPLFTEEQMREV